MAVDMFIKVGDIKGESLGSGHKEEIDVLAWSWGMTQSGTSGGGKVSVQDLSFTKWVDKASPNLMKFCCSGKFYPEALLTVRRAGDKPLEYIKIKMENVVITSVSTGGSGGEDRLTENVTLNFGKVKVEYQPQKDDGSADGGAIPMGWNIKENVEYS